ncbi:MAG TPA: carbon-nitrogen hydrolase family protein [Gammaproteobacteria bacterium]|jgi:nitrilase|nr:carbon-nitrogen hydrolase family protein [Gammaproteobacteria bacterium]
MVKVAVIQQSPVFLDKEKTIKKAVNLIKDAASSGANLVVFPETFIPGYPDWIWRLRPQNDQQLSEEIHAQLLANSVNLSADDMNPICSSAKKHNVTVVCNINERDSENSQTTIYNTKLIIGSDGKILNRHRKLMPTNPERMVHGFGDASGLKVVDTDCGKVGGLICWENYMPMARYALYAQGVEIYVAPTWDSGESWISSMRHIAKEGACWVIGSGSAIRASDIPDNFPGKDTLYPDPDEWVNVGDSVVVAPGGDIVAGPLTKEQGILYADIDVSQSSAAHRKLDVAGHYSRPDIFKLHIDTSPQSPVKLD